MPATITDTRQRGGIRPLRDFLHTEAAGGLLLAVAALAALVWANLPGTDSYSSFWHHTISIGFDGHVLALDLRHWVNEAAMTIFFLVVGLEIKRELSDGHLSTRRAAAMPALAALGGMLVPAALYLVIAFLIVSVWKDPVTSAEYAGDFLSSVGRFLREVYVRLAQFIEAIGT